MISGNKTISWKRSRPFVGILAVSALAVLPVFSQTKSSSGTDDALNKKSVVKRDPFWPVGYQPDPVRKPTEQKQNNVAPRVKTSWNDAMKSVVINGVSSRANNEFFAVINGQVKRVGDTVKLTHEGIIYTWAVDKITPPGSVKLRRVSAR